MSSHLIIGVHGLNNKPEHKSHANEWQEALREGLARNRHIMNAKFDFELAYYADINYPDGPENPSKVPWHPDPDGGALPRHEAGRSDWLKNFFREKGGEAGDWWRDVAGLDFLSANKMGEIYPDLYKYHSDQKNRAAVCRRVINVVKEHAGRRVLLVAHSMGSIVAYDALRELGREDSTFVLPGFVTLGSPLGLPFVVARALEDGSSPRTPSAVRSWKNFADRRDRVCFDNRLADDYGSNSHGVQVEDIAVFNPYLRDPNDTSTADPHGIFGYLRCPEFTDALAAFI